MKKAHIFFSAVTSHDFQGHHTMTSTTLLVRKGTKDATMKLPKSEQLFCLSCCFNAKLTQAKDIFPPNLGIRIIGGRGGLDGKRITSKDQ